MEASRSGWIAQWLMRLARWILPSGLQGWAAAMEAELVEINSPGAALRWAAGCIWVACRERLAWFLRGTPGEPGTVSLLAGEVEVRMRKLAVGILVTALAVPLLVLLAPSFRQGLAVQARLWSGSFRWPLVSAAELRAMAGGAQNRGDAETLAFAAMMHSDIRECAAWADAAVSRRPELTWLYTDLLSRAEYPAEAAAWLEALRHWAPNNGFVRVLEANHITRGMELPGNSDDRQRLAQDPRWRAAMESAFAAPEFDSYVQQELELIRTVLRRQRRDDPLLLLNAVNNATFFRFEVKRNLDIYVKEVLVGPAKEIETSQPEEAARIYRQVTAFGQRLEHRSRSRWERAYGIGMQLEINKSLRALGAPGGDPTALESEVARLEQVGREFRGRSLPAQVLGWSGRVVQICFLTGMLAVVLGAASGMVWLLQHVRGQTRLRSFCASTAAVAILVVCVSSLLFYVSYKPYSNTVDYFLNARETPRDVDALSSFGNLWSLSLAAWQLWWRHTIQLYFWYAVIGAAGIVAIWLLLRNARPAVARSG